MSEGAGTHDLNFPDGVVEGKVTYWKPLVEELRWVTTAGRLRQGVMDLQMAWQSNEGHIQWRTIPLHIMSEEEFSAKA